MTVHAGNKKLRGVNLGGWLVLEKWMTPSLFHGLTAEDETAFCIELGDSAQRILQTHWQTFITRDDFAWLAEIGINAVRIPIGHWIFGGDYPYHARYGHTNAPYVVGGLEILDQAFAWALAFDIKIVLDLHAAPGSQNGFDNSGMKDVCEWHTQAQYLTHSLDVLERLAKRYAAHPALHGIQVLNEPRWDIPTDYLKHYTLLAYQRIRHYCAADRVAVIFHDGFRSFRDYTGFMQEPDYENVILDIHRYQCFTSEDVNADIFTHIRKAADQWKCEADEIISDLRHKTYVGEWSLGLDLKMMTLWSESLLSDDSKEMDAFQIHQAYRGYAAAQLLTFEKYLGWFFWSYKTETMPQWSFCDCVKAGWMPQKFN